MPRTSVWFNQGQLDAIRRVFGDDVNLSGVVRLGLSQLLVLADGRYQHDVVREVAAASAIAQAADQLERTAGRAVRAAAEAEAARVRAER